MASIESRQQASQDAQEEELYAHGETLGLDRTAASRDGYLTMDTVKGPDGRLYRPVTSTESFLPGGVGTMDWWRQQGIGMAGDKGTWLVPYDELGNREREWTHANNAANANSLDSFFQTLPRSVAFGALGAAVAPAVTGAMGAEAGVAAGGAFDMGGVGALGSADAAAAGLGGVTAPGAAAGGATIGAEQFVDPWEVMGDKAAYGLEGAGTGVTTGAGTGAATNLGSGASGLTEGATLASEANFVPGGFELGQAAYNPLTGAIESATGKGGIINDVLKWAKENQTIVGAGLKFIQGAMAPSPEENARAIAQAKLEAEQAWLTWQRSQNQLGNLNLDRLAPSGRPLRRTGIINSARTNP